MYSIDLIIDLHVLCRISSPPLYQGYRNVRRLMYVHGDKIQSYGANIHFKPGHQKENRQQVKKNVVHHDFVPILFFLY